MSKGRIGLADLEGYQRRKNGAVAIGVVHVGLSRVLRFQSGVHGEIASTNM